MKVNIGPYTRWIGPYQLADMIFFWVDRRGVFADEPAIYNRWDYRAAEKLGDWLATSWVNRFLNWAHEKNPRKIKVRIDHYDVWSMDHTLALIIHPMLLELQKVKHGSPWIDDEDVPENLRSTAATPLTDEEKQYGTTDDLFHERWSWVLDELIWTFANIINDDAEFFEEGKGYNFEARQAHDDRISNGLRLFGKYYRGLWD